jgi:hypothetical protein
MSRAPGRSSASPTCRLSSSPASWARSPASRPG